MSGTWTERILLLGTGLLSGTTYLFGGNTDGTFVFSAGAWTQLDATFNAVACIQYNNLIYFLNEPGGAGINRTLATWDGTTFTILNPANLNTMMLIGANQYYGGSALAIYKDRLWIVQGKDANQEIASRLIFSDAGNPSTYAAATQFIDVNKGDGQKLIDLQVYADNLMLFKEHSTYAFQFTSSPADGELIKTNNVIGASFKHCMVPYENSIFVFHTGKVYEMNGNYDYLRLNSKVPFEYDSSSPATRAEDVSLSLFGDRLVVRYFNRTYVYGLRTRTWSRWVSQSLNLHNFGRLVGIPSNVSTNQLDLYYAGSSVRSNENVYILKDGYNSSDRESDGTNYDIQCTITTKIYDFANSHSFKRMTWWGADVETGQIASGYANPVIYSFVTTWGNLFNNNKLPSELSTWDAPVSTAVVPTVTGTPGTLNRVFLKFNKGLRYRQISFTLTLETIGTTADGPARIFTFTMFTKPKETVSQQIS